MGHETIRLQPEKTVDVGEDLVICLDTDRIQLADVLNKEKVCVDMLDVVIAKNRYYHVADRHNAVTWDGMEMTTTGKMLREKVIAKPMKNLKKKQQKTKVV